MTQPLELTEKSLGSEVDSVQVNPLALLGQLEVQGEANTGLQLTGE